MGVEEPGGWWSLIGGFKGRGLFRDTYLFLPGKTLLEVRHSVLHGIAWSFSGTSGVGGDVVSNIFL
jgi:hypothetical protein